MEIAVIDAEHPDAAVVARAARMLREGKLVAFPTETVYGLGANALDEAAVRRVFEAKGRPSHNPLIAHVPDVPGARALAREWPAAADALAAAFWPGPLTLVVPKKPHVPDLVTAGLDSVAVRVPSHPVALALVREAGVPIAAPSANRFTELSPTTAEHVRKSLGDRVDLLLDGGPTRVGIESTVVDVRGPRVRVLRAGMISSEALARVVGAAIDEAAIEPERADAPRASPGMIERHYAPRAELVLVAAGDRAEAMRVASEVSSSAILSLGPFDTSARRVIEMPADPDAYAQRLYAELHALDDEGVERVVAELPPDDASWAGVRDRLLRASR